MQARKRNEMRIVHKSRASVSPSPGPENKTNTLIYESTDRQN